MECRQHCYSCTRKPCAGPVRYIINNIVKRERFTGFSILLTTLNLQGADSFLCRLCLFHNNTDYRSTSRIAPILSGLGYRAPVHKSLRVLNLALPLLFVLMMLLYSMALSFVYTVVLKLLALPLEVPSPRFSTLSVGDLIQIA